MTPQEQAVFDKAMLFYKDKGYGTMQRVQGFTEGYNQCKSEYGGYNPEAMEDLVKAAESILKIQTLGYIVLGDQYTNQLQSALTKSKI